MAESAYLLQQKLRELADTWRKQGLPSTSELKAAGKRLVDWKKEKQIPGLWPVAPRLVTATLDDGWGMGLEVISLYAALAGMAVTSLGLLLEAETIIQACQAQPPDLLGLTILHFDTEAELVDTIVPALPDTVKILVGGPVFRTMTAEELSAKPYRVAADLPAFVAYLLAYRR